MTQIALAELLSELKPELRTGSFVVVTSPNPPHIRASARIIEDEGTTLVLEQSVADEHGLPYTDIFAWITLTVSSSLLDVGLTAAFTAALADVGIAANVLAGYHHDHVLVPVADAERALTVLKGISCGPAN